MTIGVLLISHQPIGQALLDVSKRALSACPLATHVLDVPLDCEPDEIVSQAESLIRELDTGDGVLVLTDLCGSTPSNIACRLHARKGINVVAGLNLPMLMRVLNYPELELDELTERAIDGGRQGVMLMPCNIPG